MDTPLIKRAYNLGLKAVPNFVEALGESEIAYYEQHLDQLQAAVRRGFVLPQPEVRPSAIIVPEPVVVRPPVFKTADADLNFWLGKCQEFAKKYLGVEVDLGRFAIPAELPWKSAIPVFDPGNLTNRDAVEKVLRAQELTVWEEVDVMKYSGSAANAEPTLHFIRNSIEPDVDTTNQMPDQLVATGKNWLCQRGYALTFGLHHFVTSGFVDVRTWTWFPNNRLASGRVASGGWYPGYREVWFDWCSSVGHDPDMGARLAMPVSLRS